MSMKTMITTQMLRQAGSALLMTMIMAGVALAMLAAALSWSSTSTRLTYRSIQYTRSEAAAEAATDKVISQISRDFLYDGEATVVNNLNTYRNTVPMPSDSAYWNTWLFNDASGNTGRTFVQREASTGLESLPPYSNLLAYVSTYTVVSDAKDTASPQDLTVGVLQQIHLNNIPIFQFAMFSSENMEISCGQPFTITGPVHSNGHLYVEPDSSMTFESDVGAVLDVLFQRDPLDTRGAPAGAAFYVEADQPVSPVAFLTLPIGATNTPEGVREIIEPAQPDDTPGLSRLRYYNQCDLFVSVTDTGITAKSGNSTPFPTAVSATDLATFITTTNFFSDAREGKIVRPIDLDVGNLAAWYHANGNHVASVYVLDQRNLLGTYLGAVRVVNGATLPLNGLTVATARPLYVLGDFNSDTANRGTTNTTATLPASLAADAITILSDNWQDTNSSISLNNRIAGQTTVNAAFLTGVVETTSGHYSGGMENFPRFLEIWTGIPFTYNGSMIKMFPSLYATNAWNNNHNIYKPPVRHWAFDTNFRDPLKLPPLTPGLLTVTSHQWAALPPGLTAAP
jgi:hypothetical protein